MMSSFVNFKETENNVKHPNEYYMRICIEEAVKAAEEGEYALAALIVVGEEIFSIRHTSLHSSVDPTGHAEILAIREAAMKVGSRYIIGGYLYSTCEPCPMCAAAAIFAKMRGIVYGANQLDAKRQFLLSQGKRHDWRQIDIRAQYVIERGMPRLELYPDFMREECLRLFQCNQ
ncbi:nucleoside deaminase [Candidatus Poribacteria bacterium]|nr:nucleoside deaminase [Candidatus Poribacteria bacterium]